LFSIFLIQGAADPELPNNYSFCVDLQNFEQTEREKNERAAACGSQRVTKIK